MRTRFTLSILLLLGVMWLAACGGAQPTSPAPAAQGIPENAALKITGEVTNEIGWTEDQVKAMDTMQSQAENNQGEMETYTGVSLNKLLDMAGVQSDASKLVFIADDGFTSEVPLADAQACGDCIVSFRNQGGFRMLMPGFEGKAQVRGVIEIQVQ